MLPIPLISRALILLVSGALVVGGIAMSNIEDQLAKYNQKIVQKNHEKIEDAKEQIEELIEDYKGFEEDWMAYEIKENSELYGEGMTKEELLDNRSLAIDKYTTHQEYPNNIEDSTLEYMKKQLPQDRQDSINRHSYNMTGNTIEQKTIWEYLQHTLIDKER